MTYSSAVVLSVKCMAEKVAKTREIAVSLADSGELSATRP